MKTKNLMLIGMLLVSAITANASLVQAQQQPAPTEACASATSEAKFQCQPQGRLYDLGGQDLTADYFASCLDQTLQDWHATAELNLICDIEYVKPGGFFSTPREAYRLVPKKK